jgi:hypothetical protein
LHVAETDPAIAEYFSNLPLATPINAGAARAFFRAQGSMRGEPPFEPELVERYEEVCAFADAPSADNLRPPEGSDDHAPSELVRP